MLEMALDKMDAREDRREQSVGTKRRRISMSKQSALYGRTDMGTVEEASSG